jgi:hypothetical protein
MDSLTSQELPRTPSPVTPITPIHSPPYPRPKHRRRDLTRSERIQCRTLRIEAGWTYRQIAESLHYSFHQVSRACVSNSTPTHRSGRPLTLSSEQINELIAYISTSRKSRRMTYFQLANGPFTRWSVSEGVIRHALDTRGYTRHIAYSKPPLSEKTRRKRLDFAQSHIKWSIEQWLGILWSDETWVNGHHRKIYVTRRKDKAYDDTCVFTKRRKPRGWMFWGCFHGTVVCFSSFRIFYTASFCART